MKCEVLLKSKEKKRPMIKTCLSCGSDVIFEHEFGILCEKCEVGLYFGIGEKYR